MFFKDENHPTFVEILQIVTVLTMVLSIAGGFIVILICVLIGIYQFVVINHMYVPSDVWHIIEYTILGCVIYIGFVFIVWLVYLGYRKIKSKHDAKKEWEKW